MDRVPNRRTISRAFSAAGGYIGDEPGGRTSPVIKKIGP